MPYARRYRRRRMVRRPNRRYKRSAGRGVKAIVKREISRSQEMKSYWNTFNEVSVNSLTPTSFYDSLIGISQGTGGNTRVGNQILVRGIHLKGALHNNSATDVMYSRILMLWYDGSSTTFDSTMPMFEGTTGLATDITNFSGDQPMWWPIAKRHGFRVLYDKCYKLAPTTANSTGSSDRRINKFLKLHKKVNFNASGSTGVYNTPRLLFCVISSQAANDDGSGIVVEFTGFCRVFYNDA